DRRPILESAWRTILRTQFHDTIAGSTADPVAAAAEYRLTEVAAYAGEVTRGALLDLAGHDANAQRERTEGAQPALLLWNPAVRGLGVAALTAGPPVPLPRGGDVRVSGRALENRFVQVALESNGVLTLVDRRRNERYGDLLRLEDGGDAGDAYSYCPPARDRIKQSRGPVTVRRIAAGPL